MTAAQIRTRRNSEKAEQIERQTQRNTASSRKMMEALQALDMESKSDEWMLAFEQYDIRELARGTDAVGQPIKPPYKYRNVKL